MNPAYPTDPPGPADGVADLLPAPASRGSGPQAPTAMTVAELIRPETPPLKPTDTVEQALGMMAAFHVAHLPVVDAESQLAGALSENALLDAPDPAALLADLLRDTPIVATPEDHVFDVTRLMMKHGLTTLPVASAGGHYEGMLRRSDLFERFAEMLSTQTEGAILTLEVDVRDYSLSQLVFTIEQNGVKILSISSEPDASGHTLIVTMKLNVLDTARVRHLLEHYGYRVIGTHGEGEGGEELQQRVDEFMRYLEV